MSNSKISPKGIKGWLFLLLEFIFLGVLFFIALEFVAPNTQVTQDTVKSLTGYFIKIGGKFLLAIVISFLEVWVVFKHVLDTKLSNILDKLKIHYNDSYAIILVGLITSVAIMIASVGDSSVQYLMYQILTRGSIGFAVATIFTVIFAKILGMNSMDELRFWIDEKANNSFVIIIVGVLIVSTILSMNV